MRAIATAAFLGGSAMTGAVTATVMFWGWTMTLGLMGVGSFAMMMLSAPGALGNREDLDERMQENRTYLTHSRPQLRRPLRRLPRPGRNGHRKTRDVLVGAPGSSIYPQRVERQ